MSTKVHFYIRHNRPSKNGSAPIYRLFLNAALEYAIINMENEAERLLKRIARMNNVYGFCARHYIKNRNSISFILQFNKEIKDGFPMADKNLKSEIEEFVNKYNELQTND